MTIPFHTIWGEVDLLALTPKDMTAFKLGDALAKLYRFNGRTDQPWSVAAHSLLVEKLCEGPANGWALLHDAHEAFIGDITSPAMELICQAGTRTAVQHAVHNAKGKLDRMIGAAWQCPPRPMSEAVRWADWMALQAEILAFFDAAPTDVSPDELKIIQREALIVRSLASKPWTYFRHAWIERAKDLERVGLLALPDNTAPTSATLAG